MVKNCELIEKEVIKIILNKKAVSIIIIFILIFMLVACSYSNSKSEGNISIKFDKFNTEKIKKFKITKNKKIIISFSDFSLQKGSLDLIIISPEGNEIYRKRFTPLTKSRGKMVIQGLKPNVFYKIILVGKNATKGKININFYSKYFKIK